MPQYHFTPVAVSESETVYALYRSLVHTPGCTWDDEYPDRASIREDLTLHALYCLRDEGGAILAVASIGDFAELDELAWPTKLQKPCELARVGVSMPMQGRGLGAQIVRACLDEAKAQGCDGVRLLVACQNQAAQAIYRKNGFVRCDQVHMYGHDYFAQQLVFE